MNIKNYFFFLLLVFFGVTASAASGDQIFKIVKSMMEAKKYQQVVPALFKMGYGNSKKITPQQKIIAQQWLGVALYRLGYLQVAAFPLISTIGQGDVAVSEKSLVTLIQITDQLKEKSILNYAVSKLDVNITTGLSKEILYSKIAEAFLGQGLQDKADENYLKVLEINPKNENALYQLGLSQLRKGSVKQAYVYFEQLDSLYENKSVLDPKRGVVTLAIARTFYQAQQWKNAIEFYKEIPKNHEFYRQSQFELAWAQFRALNFRSSLSAIETLQTPFYETYYDPESLLLRMTILLFICQVEDMDAAISKYESLYVQFPATINNWLKSNASAADVLKLINLTNINLKAVNNGFKPPHKTELPFYFIRTLLEDKKLKTQLQLIAKVKKEKQQYQKSAFAKNKMLAGFFSKIYSNRLSNLQKNLITIFREAVTIRLKEIKEYNAQFALIKYESLNTKKEQLRLSARMTDKDKNKVANFSQNINYYTENGFRYWPFQGEYWIDEIGNYQYVGVNRCVNE